MRSSRPALRARSHPWTTRSMHRNRPTAASKVDRPVIPSNSCEARSGSSRTACTWARAASHAPAGSSSTDGISPISRPTKPRNIPWVDTTWRTTSRAFHSELGLGLDHLSAGTAAILAANASDSRLYRSETSDMAHLPGSRPSHTCRRCSTARRAVPRVPTRSGRKRYPSSSGAYAVARPSPRLGLVHRRVGALQERLERLVTRRRQHDADAGRHSEAVGSDRHRVLDELEDPLGDRFQVLALLDAGEEDDEFVAAQTTGGVARTDGDSQPFAHLHQHGVAGVVAQLVVDRLEVVEVDEHEPDRPPVAPTAGD